MFLRKREREKSATRDRGDEGFVKCPVIFCYFVSSRPGRPPKRSPLMGITSPQHDVLMKMKKPRMDNGDYMPYENGHNTGRYCSNNNLKRSHHLLSVFLLLLSKAHNTLVVYLPPRLLPTFSFLSCSCYLISFFTCYQYTRDIFYLVIVALFFQVSGPRSWYPRFVVCCYSDWRREDGGVASLPFFFVFLLTFSFFWLDETTTWIQIERKVFFFPAASFVSAASVRQRTDGLLYLTRIRAVVILAPPPFPIASRRWEKHSHPQNFFFILPPSLPRKTDIRPQRQASQHQVTMALRRRRRQRFYLAFFPLASFSFSLLP